MKTVTFAIATRRGMVPVLPVSDWPASASAGWPLYATLELGALLTAPGCGRAWAAVLLREWRLIHLADTAHLAVSELLTNAVHASTGLDRPVIQLSLASDWHRLLILVRDYDPGAPYPRRADAEDEGGRGLLLVETISDRFGWYRPADGTQGKFVWAVLGTSDASAGRP
jgi:anti-sigma regulatory factor (Ser/Thr protein kinase)